MCPQEPPKDGVGREKMGGAAALALGTLLSRFLGFARDLLFAYALGPGADAFLVVFRFPNFMRRMLAEGSLGLAYGAGAGATLAEKGLEAARRIARASAASLLLLALPVCLFLGLLAKPLIFCMAPGLDGGSLEHAAFLLRLCLLYIPFCLFSAVAFSQASLEGNFRPQAWSPALWNCVILLAGTAALAFAPMCGGAEVVEYFLCAGVVAGGLVQTAVALRCLYPGPAGLRSNAAHKKPELFAKEAFVDAGSGAGGYASGTSDTSGISGPGHMRALLPSPVVNFLRSFPKTLLGSASHQLHILAAMVTASFLFPGSISSLYFAERLVELPLGVVGASLGMAALPLFSRLAAAGDSQGLAQALRLSLLRTAFLSLPAAVGLFALAHPLALALFGHGANTDSAVAATAAAISGYAFAVPALCASRPLLSGVHALAGGEATMGCAVRSLAPVVLFSFAALLLYYTHEAPSDKPILLVALGISTAAWCNAALLSAQLKKNGLALELGREKSALARYGGVALFMGCALLSAGFFWRTPGVYGTLLLAGGCAVFWFGLFYLSGSREARDFVALFRLH